MPSSLAAVVWLALAGQAAQPRKSPAPLYTNDDLERLAPRRGETGVLSQAPSPPPARPAPDAEGESRGERYWRREAERLRARLQPLRERAEELRLHLEDLERRPPAPSRRGGTGREGEARKEAARARLQSLQRRIHDEEDAFLDRARREGALPGWLR